MTTPNVRETPISHAGFTPAPRDFHGVAATGNGLQPAPKRQPYDRAQRNRVRASLDATLHTHAYDGESNR